MSADRAPVPFVVGFGRSGTTLLRLMLDAHPDLAIPPETSFVPRLIRACEADGASAESVHELLLAQRRWPDMELDSDEVLARWRALDELDPGDVLRALFGLYAEKHGKPRWGEKTPTHYRKIVAISSALPEARFVHMIRDGRDAVMSLAKVPPSIRARTTTDVAELGERWASAIRRTRRQGRKVEHYLEVHFEDLITDAEAQLRRVCEFIELDFDPAMLEYHEQSADRLKELERPLPPKEGIEDSTAADRVGVFELTAEPPKEDRIAVWRREMDPADVTRFEAVAGRVLKRLGYPLQDGPSDE